MAMRHGITRRALGRIMPARNDYTDLRPAFLDGVVHVFVVAVGQKMYSVLGLCMHAGILIYVGHRLPEIENR